jgi:hypothetical protein
MTVLRGWILQRTFAAPPWPCLHCSLHELAAQMFASCSPPVWHQ